MANQDTPRGWCWISTSDSVQARRVSLMALAETLLAVSVSIGIAYHLRDATHIVIAALLAPLLLLRTDVSVALGVQYFEPKGWAGRILCFLHSKSESLVLRAINNEAHDYRLRHISYMLGLVGLAWTVEGFATVALAVLLVLVRVTATFVALFSIARACSQVGTQKSSSDPRVPAAARLAQSSEAAASGAILRCMVWLSCRRRRPAEHYNRSTRFPPMVRRPQ